MLNSGTLSYKLVFGMIIGGALGNLIDRVRHSGYVVDFIFFRVPQIGFRFALFNIADASISVGVFLLLVIILLGGLRRPAIAPDGEKGLGSSTTDAQAAPPANNSGTFRSTE